MSVVIDAERSHARISPICLDRVPGRQISMIAHLGRSVAAIQGSPHVVDWMTIRPSPAGKPPRPYVYALARSG